MKLISETQLKKKLKKYQIIIFDLDDTIYPQKNYDNPALLSVSKYLSKHILFDKKKNLFEFEKDKTSKARKKT